MHGPHLTKHDSRTQNTIALSSAEAELYATLAAASEALGSAAMCEEYGGRRALGPCGRLGLGRDRTEEGIGQDSPPWYAVFVDPGCRDPAGESDQDREFRIRDRQAHRPHAWENQ